MATGLPMYHHTLPDKQRQFAKFLGGAANGIITTTSLSNGVNIPNLDLVLHLPGALFGLQDFCQESGRVSRNNEAGSSIVYATEAQRCHYQATAMAPPPSTGKAIAKQAMAKYVAATVCRRLILNEHFDQTSLPCGDRPVAKCDLCRGGGGHRDLSFDAATLMPPHPSLAAALAPMSIIPATIHQSSTEWNSALTTILLRSRNCSACYLLGNTVNHKHGDEGCQAAVSPATLKSFQLAISKNLCAQGVCYVCDVPLEICSKFAHHGRHCFNLVVANGCLQAFHTCPEKLTLMGAPLQDCWAFAKWLGDKFKMGSHQTSNAVAVFGLLMSEAAASSG
jgi:hypothetical protein